MGRRRRNRRIKRGMSFLSRLRWKETLEVRRNYDEREGWKADNGGEEKRQQEQPKENER